MVNLNEDALYGEILTSTVEYLERAIPMVGKLAEGFYNGPDKAVWERFNQLLEGFQWLVNGQEHLRKRFPTDAELQSLQVVFCGKLAELSEALENSDFIFMADLLNFEIIPVLESVLAHAKGMLVGEGLEDRAN